MEEQEGAKQIFTRIGIWITSIIVLYLTVSFTSLGSWIASYWGLTIGALIILSFLIYSQIWKGRIFITKSMRIE